ncbi:hypothetical protein SAMN04487830_1328 [Pseudobutyrivibrio sp. OR37]|uniref:hypothetical protein n=1 Tax=Pseudobutyrivibrio sp. OR37 TaxID=1798186 RepID=UPI0008E6B1F3|nr:hypothetical protein [Pseudobutyrivibrio sp. OR37]SFI22725.1 hypothetical protein SAMN04487830_1328 [Pseudobutyrivibrio sp. OR37]
MSFEKTVKKTMIVCLMSVMSMIFVGCGNKASAEEDTKAFIDVTDEGKKVTAYFDETIEGTMGGSGVSINDNEYLVIDSKLTEGNIHVRVVPGGNNIDEAPTKEKPATIDYVFEGEGKTEYYEIPAGSYMIKVEVDKKATGSIICSVVDNE